MGSSSCKYLSTVRSHQSSVFSFQTKFIVCL